MPAKKLDAKKLEQYKKQLLKLKEDLTRDIRSISSESGPNEDSSDSSHAMHIADVATDQYDREFNLGIASKDREIIAKIDAALKRIEDGTYGLCLETGKSIKQARLKAIPYVEYCLEYQEELEKKENYRRT